MTNRRPDGIVKDSATVGAWTLVSRATGLCRLAVVAAVLGPTYLANTFQAMNEMPNLIYFGLVGGSLLPSLLIPTLVRHLEDGDERSADRFAGGFLGLMLVGLGAVVAAAVVCGPVVVRLFTLGAGNAAVAREQRRAAVILLVLLVPQIVLYGIAGAVGAVLQARGRFALAAAAPALENMGIIATLGATAVLFGIGTPLAGVPDRQLLLLGLGTTGSVVLHLAAVWIGANRAGASLRPRFRWRDPEVRDVVSRLRPAVGLAGLAALTVFAAMALANRVAGGVVAFSLAETLCTLPVVVVATPVGVALAPRLARCTHHDDRARFGRELLGGVMMAYFLAVPASVGLLTLAPWIARAVSIGEMATPAGIALVSAALAGLAVGLLGEVAFQIGTRAAFARLDNHTPFRAMVIRTSVSAVGMLVSLSFHGPLALFVLGASLSVGALAGAGYLFAGLARSVSFGVGTVRPALRRDAGASALMLVPVAVVLAIARQTAGLPDRLATCAAVLAGGLTFVAVQIRWRSPELGSLVETLPAVPASVRRRYAGRINQPAVQPPSSTP